MPLCKDGVYKAQIVTVEEKSSTNYYYFTVTAEFEITFNLVIRKLSVDAR